MMQTKDVECEAEQQPFSGDLHISTQQETPEIEILLHIRKVAFSLNGTFTRSRQPFEEEIFASIASRCLTKRFDT